LLFRVFREFRSSKKQLAAAAGCAMCLHGKNYITRIQEPLAWNDELTTPARAHRNQHFQPINFSTVTRHAHTAHTDKSNGLLRPRGCLRNFLSKSFYKMRKKLGCNQRNAQEIRKIAASFLLAMTTILMLAPSLRPWAIKQLSSRGTKRSSVVCYS
jgi:hypothetical protein